MGGFNLKPTAAKTKAGLWCVLLAVLGVFAFACVWWVQTAEIFLSKWDPDVIIVLSGGVDSGGTPHCTVVSRLREAANASLRSVAFPLS